MAGINKPQDYSGGRENDYSRSQAFEQGFLQLCLGAESGEYSEVIASQFSYQLKFWNQQNNPIVFENLDDFPAVQRGVVLVGEA